MSTLCAMKKVNRKMYGKFQSIMSLAQQLEKKPKRFGTDTVMSHSEIHMIEIIGDVEGSSVTDISRYLEITKGAVSQSLKRLEAKGFTKKKTDPDNLSRSIVMLTSKGQAAYWAHRHWHETMDGGFLKYLDGMDEKTFEVIIEFLEITEDFLRRRLESDA